MQKRSLISLTATTTIVVGAAITPLVAGASGSGDPLMCDGVIEPGTITMFAHEGGEADAFVAAIAAYNDGPGSEHGVTVELTLIPEGDYTSQINAAAAAGDLPAILEFDGPNMANLAWAGSLLPLDSCVSDELVDNFLPSLIQQGTYNDTLYGLGSFDSGLGLYAWRSALEEVDARIPTGPTDAWTAAEFEQVLRDLQDAGYDHPLDPKFWYGIQGEWSSYAFAPIVWSAGGDLIDRDGGLTADGYLNTDEVVAAFELWQTWVDDGLLDVDASDDTNFTSKASPLSWVGHWMYGPYKEVAGDDLVVLPLPDFGNGSRTGMGSWAWGMGAGATDADAAWSVIEFLVSDEIIGEITAANGAIPGTQTAIANSPLHQAGGDLAIFVAQLEGAPDVAVPRPVTPAYPSITTTFRTVIDNIVQGADVREELDNAVALIDADIEANEGYPVLD